MPVEEALVAVVRREWRGGSFADGPDRVVCEEPLEIRIAGVPVAVTMRTPGHDEELVRGFLISEGIVTSPKEISSVRPCSDDTTGNVIQVVLHRAVDLARLRRNFYASSSCGICGKASMDGVLAAAPPVANGPSVSAAMLYTLPMRLRAGQDVFAATGGLHAAGLFDAQGEPLAIREDIGRHNAVDKAIGWAMTAGAVAAVLLVSGRISFEIVQKALAARLPIVAAVSAPSGLAVELAARANLTLIAFLRGERMAVYAGAERIHG